MIKIQINNSGLTFIELVIALAIMAIMASAVIPMSEVTVTRTKEINLRRALRDIRSAIDLYKLDYDKAILKNKILVNIDKSGFPETLEILIEGSDWGGMYPYKKKYLRHLPIDPFDKYGDGWGLRSYADEADSIVWGGSDIYDIYSQSDAIALDGTYYREW